MDSTNLHEEEYHHHEQQQQQLLQDQLLVGCSSTSSCFTVATNQHGWRPPSFLLPNNNIHAACEEASAASSNSLSNSMIENMGFAWTNPSIHEDEQSSLISSKIIKQESSSTTSSSSDHHHHKNSASSSTFPADLFLLNTLSPNYKHPMLANPEFLQYSEASKGVTTNFSQIFPTVNISNLSNSSSNNNNNEESINKRSMSEIISGSSTSSMEMSHDLDEFATARLLSEGHLLELFKFDHHHHQSNDLKLWNRANNLSCFNENGGLESKKPNCIMQPKSSQHPPLVSKKPRFESRSPCPPFKVRKEKLGDRIAALQQLVAPFGKTDTASVLMEAIGYIKFLQNQVETLSVPYMKLSSRNKSNTNNTTQRVSDEHCQSEEQKPDLKSRGLCLVPLSCMTYLASDGCNGGLWPPNFHHHGGF